MVEVFFCVVLIGINFAFCKLCAIQLISYFFIAIFQLFEKKVCIYEMD